MPEVTSNAGEIARRFRTRAAQLIAWVHATPTTVGIAARLLLLEELRLTAPVGPEPQAPPNSTRDYSHPHLRDTFDAALAVAGDGVVVRISSSAPYAQFVIEGTQPHVILPTTGQFLAFNVGGSWFFSRLVNHPGTKPNPFVERAVEATLPALRARLEAQGKSLFVRF